MADLNQLLADLEQYKATGGDMAAYHAAYNAMIATGKTPLGLNQWQRSDKPMMEDFNEDNRIVDGKLRELDEVVRQLSLEKANYEVGTWVPAFAYGDGLTYTSKGSFMKIGPLVVAFFEITFTSSGSATSTSRATINGLPYPETAGSSMRMSAPVLGNAIRMNADEAYVSAPPSGSSLLLLAHVVGTGNSFSNYRSKTMANLFPSVATNNFVSGSVLYMTEPN